MLRGLERRVSRGIVRDDAPGLDALRLLARILPENIMKPLTAIVLLAGAVLAFIAWNTEPPLEIEAREVPISLEAEPAEGNVLYAFEVEGVCCASCPPALREALSDLEGVSEIAVNTETQRVEIEAAVGMDVEDMAQAMTFDKYVARPLE
ncbi:MAG: copper chaperone CopZ [Planctomycetota bacterium]|jgi:copper chaperone CopZ